jgi:hypothetical protein
LPVQILKELQPELLPLIAEREALPGRCAEPLRTASAGSEVPLPDGHQDGLRSSAANHSGHID